MDDNLIKYGAIAVGGYFLAKYFGLIPDGLIPVTTVGSGQTVNTGGDTTASPQGNDATVANANTNTIKQQMEVHGWDVGGTYSTDYWNYYYSQIRGIPGPAPEALFPGVDRNRLYTFDEWYTAMASKGFGAIARVNPYDNPMGGNFKFGDNIAPTGMEMYIKRLGNA